MRQNGSGDRRRTKLRLDKSLFRHVFHHSGEPPVRQFLQTYHDRNSF
jgi:hypothetical protein